MLMVFGIVGIVPPRIFLVIRPVCGFLPDKHTTSGKTDNLGEGRAFSVVEAHMLLMCWSRVACVFVRRDRDAMLMVFGIVGIVPPRIFLVIRPVCGKPITWVKEGRLAWWRPTCC
jgi:hypothetical protein